MFILCLGVDDWHVCRRPCDPMGLCFLGVYWTAVCATVRGDACDTAKIESGDGGAIVADIDCNERGHKRTP